MKIKELLDYLEGHFPLVAQDSWDNSGLQVGDVTQELRGVLVAVDVTEAVVEETMERGCNLVVAHHPLLFHPLKKITPKSYVERCVALALKHDIVLYAAHTNLDNAPKGVNHYWAEQMGLEGCRVLEPIQDFHYKLVTYVPHASAEKVRYALKEAGIGVVGAYEGTSFSTDGEGRFIPSAEAHPYVGEVGTWHVEPEVMISTLCSKADLSRALSALRGAHPYEEPAIDIYPMHIKDEQLGAGIIGELPEATSIAELFDRMRQWQPLTQIAHSKILKDPVRRIAYCGGSGSFLMEAAYRAGADIFITGEAKYNHFYDATDRLTLVTIGHYESEDLTKAILFNTLSGKSGNFAIYKSKQCSNPISFS